MNKVLLEVAAKQQETLEGIILMSPTKQLEVEDTKKPVIQPKLPKSNPKTSKNSKRTSLSTRAVNGGIVISNILLNIAQCASLPGVQHAAQAASMVFTTIEVCGGTSLYFCIEI